MENKIFHSMHFHHFFPLHTMDIDSTYPECDHIITFCLIWISHLFVQLSYECVCLSARLCLYVIKILHFHEIEAMHMMCRWLCQRGVGSGIWMRVLRCVFMERWYRLSLVFIWSILLYAYTFGLEMNEHHLFESVLFTLLFSFVLCSPFFRSFCNAIVLLIVAWMEFMLSIFCLIRFYWSCSAHFNKWAISISLLSSQFNV